MGLLDHIMLGVAAAFSGPALLGIPLNLLMVAGGFFFGVVVGATPGLAGPLAMAIALPILISVFGYEASALLPVLGFLLGIMKGATLGGAVPAILFNTPGTPDALLTTFDGYPLTRKGQGRKALKVAHFSSVSGDSFSDVMLFICAPFLAILVEAYLDLPEKAALILLSLTFIAAVMGKSLAKGMIAVAFGLFVAAIGTGEGFDPRLDFGVNRLGGGFPIGIVVLGILVIGEVFMVIYRSRSEMQQTGNIRQPDFGTGGGLTGSERLRILPHIGRSALIGTGIGALPGIGTTLAATLGYTYGAARHRKNRAKDAPDFGKGAIEGVASTEAANSAVSGANMIPVLSLGIPGNTAAIFIILAMESIDGINPGPGVFILPPEGVNSQMVLVFGMFTLMVLANIINWFFGGRIMQMMAGLIRIPKQILMPAVILVTCAGIYSEQANMLALAWLIGFGVFGFLMRLFDFPVLPFVVAFILGRPLEVTARQAFAATGGDPWFLFSSPVALAFMLGSVVVLFYFLLKGRRAVNAAT